MADPIQLRELARNLRLGVGKQPVGLASANDAYCPELLGPGQ